MMSTRSISQLQQSWRRIDANQSLVQINLDADLLRHRNQELTSRVVFDDQNFDSALSHYLAYAAYGLSVNRLNPSAFQLTFRKLSLRQLNVVACKYCQFESRK